LHSTSKLQLKELTYLVNVYLNLSLPSLYISKPSIRSALFSHGLPQVLQHHTKSIHILRTL